MGADCREPLSHRKKSLYRKSKIYFELSLRNTVFILLIAGRFYIQYLAGIMQGIHGWLVSMATGGELAAHMHDPGWITGGIYIHILRDQTLTAAISFCAKTTEKMLRRKSVSEEKALMWLLVVYAFFRKTLFIILPFENEENRIVCF